MRIFRGKWSLSRDNAQEEADDLPVPQTESTEEWMRCAAATRSTKFHSAEEAGLWDDKHDWINSYPKLDITPQQLADAPTFLQRCRDDHAAGGLVDLPFVAPDELNVKQRAAYDLITNTLNAGRQLIT